MNWWFNATVQYRVVNTIQIPSRIQLLRTLKQGKGFCTNYPCIASHCIAIKLHLINVGNQVKLFVTATLHSTLHFALNFEWMNGGLTWKSTSLNTTMQEWPRRHCWSKWRKWWGLLSIWKSFVSRAALWQYICKKNEDIITLFMVLCRSRMHF